MARPARNPPEEPAMMYNYEALCLEKAVLEAEITDLKQQIFDLYKELEEDPVIAELCQKLKDVIVEYNKIALYLTYKSSCAIKEDPEFKG
ncbi:hypothetical protein BDV09DRAFT_197611 [Aspergillus tetrazonus]